MIPVEQAQRTHWVGCTVPGGPETGLSVDSCLLDVCCIWANSRTDERMVAGMGKELTVRGGFVRLLKPPGASEGHDSSNVASASTNFL